MILSHIIILVVTRIVVSVNVLKHTIVIIVIDLHATFTAEPTI